MADRRVLLGQVGVDSGQLTVMAPGYISSQWISEEDATPIAVRFWGLDADLVKTRLQSTYPDMQIAEARPGFYSATDVNDYPQVQRVIESMARSAGWRVAAAVVRHDTYRQICEATSGPNQGGGIPYTMGHDGLAVAFRAGLGDGVYDVYATIGDVPEWGERVKKVEIILIDDASAE